MFVLACNYSKLYIFAKIKKQLRAALCNFAKNKTGS
jgi:hypothetical protein